MYGLDLDKELAKGRFGWLLDRILDLPDPYSRFREAMSEDEEMADILLELENYRAEEEGKSATLRYSQVGLKESLLISIDMSLKALRAEAPHLHGAKGKPKYPKPWPMPKTAVERKRFERDKQAARDVMALFGFGPEDFQDEDLHSQKPKSSDADAEAPLSVNSPPSKAKPIDPDMRRVWYASRIP